MLLQWSDFQMVQKTNTFFLEGEKKERKKNIKKCPFGVIKMLQLCESKAIFVISLQKRFQLKKEKETT